MNANWSYIERIETKVTPPELQAYQALAELEGVSMSELIRRALLAELEDQYPAIARALRDALRRPAANIRLASEIVWAREDHAKYERCDPAILITRE